MKNRADIIEKFPQEELISALENKDHQFILNIAHTLKPADLALMAQQLSVPLQIQLFEQIPNAAYVFEHLSLSEQLKLAEKFDFPKFLDLMSSMHSDKQVALFKALPQALQNQLLSKLDTEDKNRLQASSVYHSESAGAIMSSDFVTLPPYFTMQQSIDELRQVAADRETLYLIYVTNDNEQLEGVISLRQIIQSAPTKKIDEVMSTDLIVGNVNEDRESIARKLSHYDFIALPIVDDRQHLLGIVTYDDAMDVFQQEFTEDALKGSAVKALPNMSLKRASIFSLYRQRVFWLVILVFGSLLSGIGIAHFEDIIAANIVLVFFLPLLVGSGGNAGSQSSTLMVRAIATGDVQLKDWFYLLGRESLVALCLGGTMAIAVSILGYIRGDEMVALVLALSMIGIVLIGCLIGMSLPFILNKLGLDPASASAPLVTSICDATGVIIYLFIASQLLLNVT